MQLETPIDEFLDSAIVIERNIPSIILSWITILFLFLFSFIYIALFYEYHPYLNYFATVIQEEGEIYLTIYMENDQVSTIQNANLMVEQKEYPFVIKQILDEYAYPIQSDYKTVMISCPIEEVTMENHLLPITFKLPKTTLMKKFLTILKKGVFH